MIKIKIKKILQKNRIKIKNKKNKKNKNLIKNKNKLKNLMHVNIKEVKQIMK